jgi:predicted nucleic-acid-binding protein
MIAVDTNVLVRLLINEPAKWCAQRTLPLINI